MRKLNSGFHSAGKGNTLAEYSVIAGLVVVVCVAGFMVFGGHFLEYLTGLKADLGGNISQANSATSAGSIESMQKATGKGDLSLSMNPSQMGELTGPNGETIDLKDISENGPIGSATKAGQAVMTAGGLGVDQLHSEAIAIGDILAKMEAEGYDPDNIGWVKWAADNGYTTAGRIAESWAACPPQGSCTDWGEAANARVWAETYATGVKPAYVGTDQLGGQQDDLYNVYNAFKNEPGILADRPAEKAAIIQHLENIISISKTSGSVLMERTAGTDSDLAVDNKIDYTPYQVQQDVDGIKQNSDGICDNGGGSGCKQG